MNVTIPDKIYKLLILIGMILVGYSEYNYQFKSNEIDKVFHEMLTLSDTLALAIILEKYEVDFSKLRA